MILIQNQLIYLFINKAVTISGTSAGLKEGESLFAIDLFYGLMLPSGNDAGYTLASYFGNVIINN